MDALSCSLQKYIRHTHCRKGYRAEFVHRYLQGMVRPKLPRKIEILLEAVEVARALGEPTPRVAMMAASEKIIDGMPETFDAAELARRSLHGEFPGILIQGPLSFDLAYAPTRSARRGSAAKWPASPISCSSPTSRRPI